MTIAQAGDKEFVRRRQGAKIADEVFDTPYQTMPKWQEHQLTVLQGVIEILLARKGYCYRDDLIENAWKTLQQDTQWHKFKSLKNTWAAHGADILDRIGAKYAKPNAAQRERYGLPDDRWIITLKE